MFCSLSRSPASISWSLDLPNSQKHLRRKLNRKLFRRTPLCDELRRCFMLIEAAAAIALEIERHVRIAETFQRDCYFVSCVIREKLRHFGWADFDASQVADSSRDCWFLTLAGTHRFRS